jgi:uncharacterized protein YndB with AHSA1/START domain
MRSIEMNRTGTQQIVISPIIKSVTVDMPIDAAFRLFTKEAGRWWPLRTHSVGGEDAVECVLEGRVGGRFYEIQKDGSQSDWGEVQVWEPPHKLIMTFHPGRSPVSATEVEVEFQATPTGTIVTLTHRGWERCSTEVQAERPGYETGWDYVLGFYVEQSSS